MLAAPSGQWMERAGDGTVSVSRTGDNRLPASRLVAVHSAERVF